jgi:hypothetical protein
MTYVQALTAAVDLAKKVADLRDNKHEAYFRDAQHTLEEMLELEKGIEAQTKAFFEGVPESRKH